MPHNYVLRAEKKRMVVVNGKMALILEQAVYAAHYYYVSFIHFFRRR